MNTPTRDAGWVATRIRPPQASAGAQLAGGQRCALDRWGANRASLQLRTSQVSRCACADASLHSSSSLPQALFARVRMAATRQGGVQRTGGVDAHTCVSSESGGGSSPVRGMAGVASPPRSSGHCTAGARAAAAAASAAAGSEASASNALEGAEVDGAEAEAEARESESSSVARSAGGSCLTGAQAALGTKRGGSFSPRRCHVTAAATAAVASTAARNMTASFVKLERQACGPWRTRRC
jgi:hypothetical protein